MNREIERLNTKETIICLLVYALIAAVFAWLFYDSAKVLFLFAPLFFLFLRAVKRIKLKKVKEEMTGQFIRMLSSLSTSLCAGVSVERSFENAAADMEKLYGKGSVIKAEMDILNSGIHAGKRPSEALSDLAKRWKIQEIADLSVVFSTAVRNGGDLPTVISSCSQIMENKRQTEEEARIMIRGKQYEQRVMCVIPPGILAYLRLSSGNFTSMLYHNVFGISVMTACLMVYVLAIYISERIGDIKV